MQEGLTKDSVANEDGRGNPGWQVLGCRAQGDWTAAVNPAYVQTWDRRISVRISVQRNHKPQAIRGEQPGTAQLNQDQT